MRSIRIALLSSLVLALSGCSAFSFLSPRNEPDRKWHHVETITLEPRFVIIEGKAYPVVDKVEGTYELGLDQHQPKIPGWKKVLNAIFGWSFVGGIAILALTALGVPAVPALFLAFRRIRNSNKHLHQIVAGVDDGLSQLPEDQQEKFKTALAKIYDSDTKKEVNRIKEAK